MPDDTYKDDDLGAPEDLLRERFNVPNQSPVQPQQLTVDSEFRFHCHPGVSCFNECCRNITIQVTPWDIVRLRKRFGMTSSEFVSRYTVPFEMDHHGMPGLNMMTKPGTPECVFLGEEGCTVYEDRPVACRFYALGNMAVRKKEASQVEDIYFVVREEHCKGHEEPRRQTVGQYLEEQGTAEYEEMNAAWRDVIIKKRSSGPTIGAPSERSLQLFDMCSYDTDSFREFLQTPSFGEVFDVPAGQKQVLIEDDAERVQFAIRLLKQVLFGEMSIPLKEGARETRLEKRRDRIQEKRKQAIEAHHNRDLDAEISPQDK